MRIAMMGAIMYGSMQSILPDSRKNSIISTKLPGGIFILRRRENRLLIEVHKSGEGIHSYLEKP